MNTEIAVPVKRALVTGASEGIGREFSIQLAKKGYAVTAVARSKDRLDSLMQDIRAISPDSDLLVADLSTPDGIQRVCESFGKKHYSLLVNNAGFGVYGEFRNTPLDKLNQMLMLNCTAVTSLLHAFLQTARAGDNVINVASVGAFIPLPQNALYAATKSLVTALTLGVWHEEKQRDVYVMALCPGYTKTLFHERAGGTPKNAGDTAVKNHPDNRALSSFVGQTAAAVVDTALRAIERRSNPIVIPGIQNQIMVEIGRILPRSALTNLAAALTADYYK